MSTYVFQVSLATPEQQKFVPQYSSVQNNFAPTRSTWIPDNLIDNRVLKDGGTVTASGLQGLYLANNYTTGDFALLTIVSQSISPP